MIDLKAKRKEKGYTQAKLAKEVGLKRTSIANIESGFNLPSIETAKRIAKVLEFDWYDFLKTKGENKMVEKEMLYTVKEAAQILKTNVNYVHELRKNGLLPFLKLGSYKVRRSALEDFLAKYEGFDLTIPSEIKPLDNAIQASEEVSK